MWHGLFKKKKKNPVFVGNMEIKRQTKAGSVEFSEHFQVNKEK